MRSRLILSLAVLAAAALPAAAPAATHARASFSGVVVAKEASRGTLVVASRSGLARTVHARLSAARLGDRVSIGGTRLKDGTFRAASLRVVGHAKSATVRGVIVRRLSTRTLVSTGRSVIAIERRSATRTLASRGLAPGTVATFGVSFSGGRVREISASALSTTSTVEVEGKVVTLSPFVVNVEGLPITIGLGAVTLPAALAIGDEVELTVTVGANNVFTLVSVDEFQSEPAAEPGDDQGDDNQPGQGQEVEVEGTVVSSSATQVVVADKAGVQTTFVAGPGVTLPILATGTRVEAKGIQANGVVTLVKLEVKGADDDSGGSGSSGGSDDSGGSGSGDDGGSGGGDDGGGDGGGGGGDD